MENLSERQQTLYEWLKAQSSVSIDEIETHFSVSPATAYRDARALINAGVAVKTPQGIKIAPSALEGRCAFCNGVINERMAFIFHLQDGSQRKACCPHCGLMGIGQLDVVSALSSDFLYGRMVNARQAVFLVESSVSLCCAPSVLCFATRDEALNFQKGFGGQLCSLDEAAAWMRKTMSIQS
jgi:hypothetical protein